MFGKLSRTLRGSQVDICSETAYSERRSQSVANMKQKQRKGRRISRLFGSDNEEEINSVVSDIPGMYGRSSSMNTLTEGSMKNRKKSVEGKLEKVEAKMKSIQASLSTMAAPDTHTRDIYQLKKELESQESFITQLKKSVYAAGRGPDQLLEARQRILGYERERKLRQLTEKRKKLSRLKSNENIDACINAAELEFSIERDQVEVMNLSQEIQSLQERLERGRGEEGAGSSALYRLVAATPPPGLTLLARELQPSWARDILSMRQGSLQVSQAMFNLHEGDLVLELNGEPCLNLTEDEWQERRRSIVPASWRIVVGRRPPPGDDCSAPGGGREAEGGGCELAGLQQDIALIQSRLEEKLREGRDMGSILQLVQREKEGLERENTRLNHRIFYLEEQVADLQKSLRQVRDSLSRTLNTEIQDTLHRLGGGDGVMENIVQFQRGKHMASIEVPLDTVSSSSGVYSGAGSEGSNSPDSHHVARLLVTQTGPPAAAPVAVTGDNRRPAQFAAGNKCGGNRSDANRNDLLLAKASVNEIYGDNRDLSATTMESGGGSAGGVVSSGQFPKCGRKMVERANSRVANLSGLVRLPFARLPQQQLAAAGSSWQQ